MSTEAETKRKQPGCAVRLLLLIIKLAIISGLVFLIFTYVFGIARDQSMNMQPAIQDGDLLFYYRIVQRYTSDQVVVVPYQGRSLPARVIAVAGDKVDITADGLEVNGSLLSEPGVLGETLPYEDAVTFPLTVPSGQVFLLGDNRENAVDSRVFGCVDEDDVQGKLIGLFRRRNF